MNLNVNEREPETVAAGQVEEPVVETESQTAQPGSPDTGSGPIAAEVTDQATDAGDTPQADKGKTDRKSNLINLLFGVAAFALYLYAMSVFFAGAGTVNGLGFGAATPSVDMFEGRFALMMEEIDLSLAVPLYYYAILLIAYLVISVIMIVNLIRAFICLLGLLRLGGERAKSEKRALKLNNLVFGGVGSVIAFAVLCSLSGDGLSSNAKALMAVAGVFYGLLLVLSAVRRQLACRERSWLRFALDLIRDFIMSGLAVIAVYVLAGSPIRDASVAFDMAINGADASALVSQIVRMAVCLFQVFLMLAALSILKKTLKFYIFNSAKRKDINDILSGKYIALLTVTHVFWLIGSGCGTCLVFSNGQVFAFDASMLSTWAETLVESYLPVLLAAVGGIVLVNYVGGEERKGAARAAQN